VTATAWNAKSSTITTLDVTIVDLKGLPCFTPDASIYTPPGGHIHKMSEMVLLDGLFTLNCSGYLTTR
jgi:hypothetical protein